MDIGTVWALTISAAVVITAVTSARMQSRIKTLEDELEAVILIMRQLKSRDTYGIRK